MDWTHLESVTSRAPCHCQTLVGAGRHRFVGQKNPPLPNRPPPPARKMDRKASRLWFRAGQRMDLWVGFAYGTPCHGLDCFRFLFRYNSCKHLLPCHSAEPRTNSASTSGRSAIDDIPNSLSRRLEPKTSDFRDAQSFPLQTTET